MLHFYIKWSEKETSQQGLKGSEEQAALSCSKRWPSTQGDEVSGLMFVNGNKCTTPVGDAEWGKAGGGAGDREVYEQSPCLPFSFAMNLTAINK